MGKRIRDYVKYTLSELESYVKTPTSCIKRINNTPLHLNFPPFGLINFRESLQKILAERKIGLYDADLKGIILDIRKLKVLSNLAALRSDDPALHLNLEADCYVFQPQVGAVVRGLVKFISDRQIGVIIYRVFSVSIRLNGSVPNKVTLNSEIEFRIKQFDFDDFMPFIEGELIDDFAKVQNSNKSNSQTINTSGGRSRSVKFEPNAESPSSGYNSDGHHWKPRGDTIRKEQLPTDSESESEEKPLDVVKNESRNATGSPDLFSQISSSDNDEEELCVAKTKKALSSQQETEKSPLKIKKEKQAQDSIYEKPSKHKAIKRVATSSGSNSDAEKISSFQRVKSEKLSQDANLNSSPVVKPRLKVKEELSSDDSNKKSKRKDSNLEKQVSEEKTAVRIKSEIESHMDNSDTESVSRKSKKAKKREGVRSENTLTTEEDLRIKVEVLSQTESLDMNSTVGSLSSKKSKKKKTNSESNLTLDEVKTEIQVKCDQSDFSFDETLPDILSQIKESKAFTSSPLVDNSGHSQTPKKRKHTESTSETPSDGKFKRRKESENFITEVHLDSDFEMTTVTPISKHKKKKKKSKQQTEDAPEEKKEHGDDSEFLNPNDVTESLNLINNSSSKKKKKSKHKDNVEKMS